MMFVSVYAAITGFIQAEFFKGSNRNHNAWLAISVHPLSKPFFLSTARCNYCHHTNPQKYLIEIHTGDVGAGDHLSKQI
jgi:hypothetical protein